MDLTGDLTITAIARSSLFREGLRAVGRRSRGYYKIELRFLFSRYEKPRCWDVNFGTHNAADLSLLDELSRENCSCL